MRKGSKGSKGRCWAWGVERLFTQNLAEQREVMFLLGDTALTEHAGWTPMQRERQVEHSKL
ncbi:hypothetical protein ACPPVV_11660 [Rhodanobacter sp. Col0626]|uniref:hypothetical protein n=1 Tax=Rhodanobacter sp. Col0626 TaxID=3415679 RepID=UPI003CECAC2C